MRLKRVRRTLFLNTIMKKILIPIFVLTILGLASCKDKPTSSVNTQSEFQLGLTNEDSTTIVNLGDQCMNLLKEGQIEQALDMLCLYDDSLKEISPLTDDVRASYQRKFTILPVKEFEMSYFSFSEEGLNDLKYNVSFGADVVGAPRTSYMFNPVKVGGKWYLSVKTSMQDVDELMR